MTSWAKDRLDCEVFGTSSQLYHKCTSVMEELNSVEDEANNNGAAGWSGNTWSAYEELGGTFIYSPAALCLREGNLHLFGIGSDSALWHKYYESGWTPAGKGWTSLGGVCMTPPVVVRYGEKQCAAFVIGTDRACWVAMGLDNSTFKWVSLNGKLTGDSLTVCSWGNGRMDVFGIGTDSALYHTYYDGGKWWGSWESLGGQCIGKPKAVCPRSGRIDIFTKGMDSSMYHLCFNGTWQAWQGLGGVHIYEPDAVCWDANRIDLFSISTDTKLTHVYANISNNEVGKFEGNWEKLGGTCTGSPRVVSRGQRLLDIFVKGTGQQMLQKTYNASGWVPAGASLSDLGGVCISNTA